MPVLVLTRLDATWAREANAVGEKMSIYAAQAPVVCVHTASCRSRGAGGSDDA